MNPMGNGVIIPDRYGPTDRQVALIAAAIVWSPDDVARPEWVFETAEKYLEWLRKEL